MRWFWDIRAGEARVFWGGFATLFLMMVGHAAMETARDALFLGSLPASRLPIAYLLITVATFVAVTAMKRLPGRHPKLRLFIATLGAGLGTVALYVCLPLEKSSSLYVLYVWAGVAASIMVLQVWVALGSHVVQSQAKRLFLGIGAGAVLGGMVGSFSAAAVVHTIAADGLLLFSALSFIAASLFVAFVFPSDSGPPARNAPSARSSGNNRRFVRLVLLCVLIGTVCMTLADYLFKSVLSAEVAAEDLGQTFGLIYGCIGGASLITQLALGPWLLQRIGSIKSLGILPILMLLSAATFVAFPILPLVLVVKGFEGGFKHSLYSTSVELTILPLPTVPRQRAKALVDIIGKRGGQALASVALLGVVQYTSSPRVVGIATAVLALIWCVMAAWLLRPYLALFASKLRGADLAKDSALVPLDLQQLEALIKTLNSTHVPEVISAINLLHSHRRTHLIPTLVLYHPNRRVVLRALEIFAETGRREIGEIALYLAEGDDEEIRAAAIRAQSAIDPELDRLLQFRDDRSPLMRATALVALWNHGLLAQESLRADVEQIIDSEIDEAKVALANALQVQPIEEFSGYLLTLAKDQSPQVRLAAARAMSVTPKIEFVEALTPMLANYLTRGVARDAIIAIGPRVIPRLAAILADDSSPLEIRRHLPRTISRFPSQTTADIIIYQLEREQDGVTAFKLLRGLGRLHAQNPTVDIDASWVNERQQTELRRIGELMRYRQALTDSGYDVPTASLLTQLIADKERNALERVFRLQGLVTPISQLESVYVSSQSEDPEVQESARELIANWPPSSVRDAILVLLDRTSLKLQLEGLPNEYTSPEQSKGSNVLKQLLLDKSSSIQALAADLAATVGDSSCIEQLERAASHTEPFAQTSIRNALVRLRP